MGASDVDNRASPSPHFQTVRLEMRPLDERDAPLYCALYTTPELMRNIAPPMAHDAALRSFNAAYRKQLSTLQRWIVSERKSGKDVGLLGLIGAGEAPEIGVMLLEEAHGRGYGTEALDGMMEWAFTRTALQRIYAHQSVVDNPPVIRMMLRLGFTSLPATESCPQGGEWLIERVDWQRQRIR
jgi:RimJ/RimL family protein N-acetyltransferase